MQPVFHERSFASAFRAGDSRRFGIDLKNDRQKILDAAIAQANASPIVLGPGFSSTIKGRPCWSLPDYSQNLILRLTSNYISRRLRVEAGNRDRKVTSLIEALTDSTPFFVVRRDIRSFYETVPTIGLYQRLVDGSDLPPSVRAVVRTFFHEFCSQSTAGLPRGICLSTVLAELAMQDFDARVRELNGVYRYYRYSDDIIILSYHDPSNIESKLPDLLPSGMCFNASKSHRIDLNKPNKQSTEKCLEYLGYRFTFQDYGLKRDPRIIKVSIAEKKLTRIKTRIMCAFKAHAQKSDFQLLRKRIAFIAGNMIVMRQNVSAIKSSRYVKSGIYYNYKLCGEYNAGVVAPHKGDELKAIDGFYQSIITKSTSFGAILTAAQQSALRKISFFKGYSLKHTAKYTATEIQEIKSIWKNV